MRDFFRSLEALVLLAFAFMMAGCGADDGPPGTVLSDAGPATCNAGEMMLDDGRCQPAGLPLDMPCPPGEAPLDGGGCQPAGVPPDDCGQGFEPDGQAGCNPILPADACPPGQMAVPGDTRCREVAPCGDGDYGTIPVEATTQFVNEAYPGSDSDGTRARPWKLIQQGISHAQSGAIVAVAAGRYLEDILIRVKPIRLWGRCPALVEVVGAGANTAALEILSGRASHSEVHNLAITGPRVGLGTSGASEVVVDHVWIHDTMAIGLRIDKLLGPTSVKMSASLIEATNDLGVFIEGSDAMIEATVVRAAKPISNGESGVGVMVQDDLATQERATLTLRTSLLEQNHDVGVLVFGSDATIEATVVRDTLPRSDGTAGRGILIQERATLTLRASLLTQNHESSVFVAGSDATIEATVVRDTLPRSDGTAGFGIEILEQPNTDERSKVTLRTSLLEQNHNIGVLVTRSDATIEATIVRNTLPRSDGTFGFGIHIQDSHTIHERAKLTLRTSLLEQNHDIGVAVLGSDATIEATVVRDTLPRSDGTAGRGLSIEMERTTYEHSRLTLRTSLLEQNHDVGVAVLESDATIDATVVRDTQPRSDGTFGDGIAVFSYGLPTTVNITSTKVESSARAGISNFSAAVTFVSSTVQCNRIDLDGEDIVEGQPFTFDGSKENLCGCGDKPDPSCSVLSANLTPPDPILPILPSP